MNMSNKSTNPKGTKDYGPSELLSIRFIINKIRNVFISFGYSEIETPSIEKRATLYEKYGNEGDKFIFNIINSGEKVKKADVESLSAGKLNQFVSSISEKGLRFDLTVPLARFVAQHFNEINFPLKGFKFKKYGDLIDLSEEGFKSLHNVMLTRLVLTHSYSSMR